MKTEIFKPSKKNIKLAASELAKGNLIAFPTETVYGLGANAFNKEAVEKIFIAKNRPQDNPLIVHIHKNYDLLQIVKNIPETAKNLIKHFTPSPLTIIMQSNNKVCPEVSCGLKTLAVRIPSHKVAQKLLKACNLPIAAPSANTSKHLSPTTAKAVKDDLNKKLEIILNGGKCKIGLESTVIDVTKKVPVILRLGAITKEMIKEKTGITVNIANQTNVKIPPSPGMKYKHYSPKCEVFISEENKEQQLNLMYDNLIKDGYNPVIVCLNSLLPLFKNKNKISLGKSEKEAANKLYDTLRMAENKYNYILLCPVKSTGIGKAVNNRISKMSSK